MVDNLRKYIQACLRTRLEVWRARSELRKRWVVEQCLSGPLEGGGVLRQMKRLQLEYKHGYPDMRYSDMVHLRLSGVNCRRA